MSTEETDADMSIEQQQLNWCNSHNLATHACLDACYTTLYDLQLAIGNLDRNIHSVLQELQ